MSTNENVDSKIIQFDQKQLGGVAKNRNSHSHGGVSNTADITSIEGNRIGEDTNNMRSKGDDAMDILEKYIEKIDRDQSDLRDDIRASEQRTADLIKTSEDRMDKRMDRMEALFDRVDKKFDSMEAKIDSKFDSMEAKVDSTNKWITGVCLATIVGIATMVVTVLVTLY